MRISFAEHVLGEIPPSCTIVHHFSIAQSDQAASRQVNPTSRVYVVESSQLNPVSVSAFSWKTMVAELGERRLRIKGWERLYLLWLSE